MLDDADANTRSAAPRGPRRGRSSGTPKRPKAAKKKRSQGQELHAAGDEQAIASSTPDAAARLDAVALRSDGMDVGDDSAAAGAPAEASAEHAVDAVAGTTGAPAGAQHVATRPADRPGSPPATNGAGGVAPASRNSAAEARAHDGDGEAAADGVAAGGGGGESAGAGVAVAEVAESEQGMLPKKRQKRTAKKVRIASRLGACERLCHARWPCTATICGTEHS